MAGKRKSMTMAEKNARKTAREQLRKEGILPSPKKRLDRKVFAREVLQKFDDQGNWNLYIDLLEAVVYMIPDSSVMIGVSSEQVGVLKMLKIAMDLHEYKQNAAREGRQVNHLELWEKVVKPIWNL